MADTILSSIKELLAVPKDVTVFDAQLVILINMALKTLSDIIVGPEVPYQIDAESGGDITACIPDDPATQSLVLTYLYHKVRLQFDPPTSSAVLSALQNSISEDEWRLGDYVVKTTTPTT